MSITSRGDGLRPSENGHIQLTPEQVGVRAAEAVAVKAGRPTDALRQRSALRTGGYGDIVDRRNLYNYRPRAGSTVLETLRIIRDRDPDAAQAVMNYLLLMGQGYRADAVRPQPDAEGQDVPDPRAQAAIRAFDAQVGDEYGGGMDNLVDVLHLTLVTQGAMAAELELADDLRAVVDVHPIDPARITFKRDEQTGRLRRGLMAPRNTDGADADGFFELNPRQVRYIPLHPDVDAPYGRSPLLAALTAIFFKIELLEDLKAVVHNQGYPRLDVSVLQAAVIDAMPAAYKAPGREEDAEAFVSGFLTQLQEAYNALKPDDTFIHWDSVTVQSVGGAGGSIDFRALASVLDTQIVAGLKQLPVLLGRNEGATTTHATVQWRIFALQIEAMQRRTKRLLEWVHTTMLQVAGIQARVTVTFDTQPTSERLVDAQAFATETRTWGALIDRGLATRDEAAQELLGHPAAVAEAPEEESL